MASSNNTRTSTLLTADLDSYFSPNDSQMHEDIREVIRHLDHLKRDNDALLAENVLLRRQLYLAKENASLRVASVLSAIVSWFDDDGQPNANLRTIIKTSKNENQENSSKRSSRVKTPDVQGRDESSTMPTLHLGELDSTGASTGSSRTPRTIRHRSDRSTSSTRPPPTTRGADDSSNVPFTLTPGDLASSTSTQTPSTARYLPDASSKMLTLTLGELNSLDADSLERAPSPREQQVPNPFQGSRSRSGSRSPAAPTYGQSPPQTVPNYQSLGHSYNADSQRASSPIPKGKTAKKRTDQYQRGDKSGGVTISREADTYADTDSCAEDVIEQSESDVSSLGDHLPTSTPVSAPTDLAGQIGGAKLSPYAFHANHPVGYVWTNKNVSAKDAQQIPKYIRTQEGYQLVGESNPNADQSLASQWERQRSRSGGQRSHSNRARSPSPEPRSGQYGPEGFKTPPTLLASQRVQQRTQQRPVSPQPQSADPRSVAVGSWHFMPHVDTPDPRTGNQYPPTPQGAPQQVRSPEHASKTRRSKSEGFSYPAGISQQTTQSARGRSKSPSQISGKSDRQRSQSPHMVSPRSLSPVPMLGQQGRQRSRSPEPTAANRSSRQRSRNPQQSYQQYTDVTQQRRSRSPTPEPRFNAEVRSRSPTPEPRSNAEVRSRSPTPEPRSNGISSSSKGKERYDGYKPVDLDDSPKRQQRRSAGRARPTVEEVEMSSSYVEPRPKRELAGLGKPLASSTPLQPTATERKKRKQTPPRTTVINQSSSSVGLPDLTPSRRLLGEIAYQFDRRFLNYVFNSSQNAANKKRYYGYIIQNIPDMIEKEVGEGRDKDVAMEMKLNYRYQYVLRGLKPLGYDVTFHSDFSVMLVNKYGLLPTPEEGAPMRSLTPGHRRLLRDLVIQTAPDNELMHILILLDCLILLAKDDGKPLLMW